MSQLVPLEKLGNANGLIEIGLVQLLCPAISGFLLKNIGLFNILLIDCVTFSVAQFFLIFVKFPPPTKSKEGESEMGDVRFTSKRSGRFFS